MEFILSTGNPGKLAEMKNIMNSLNLNIVLKSKTEIGIFEDVEETGETFEENALLKAQDIMGKTGKPAIADDSGLMVDALDGEPGVFSARYAGENKTDPERVEYLLERLSEVNEGTERTARFVSVIACMFPSGVKIICRGECEGLITKRARGNNGFGYDPVFFVEEMGKTFAEMSGEEKNKVSHRGKALRLFAAELKKYMDGDHQ